MLASKRDVQFEGETSAQRDFRAPPKEAFLSAFQHSGPREPAPARRDILFEGVSSSHSAHVTPPVDAFRHALAALDKRPLGSDKHPQRQTQDDGRYASQALAAASTGDVKFEGESSARRDFQAPPKEALLTAFEHNGPRERLPARSDISFEGVSSSHLAHQPYSVDALKEAAPRLDRVPLRETRAAYEQHSEIMSARQAVKFEGESSSRRDFQAPQTDALLNAFQQDRQREPGGKLNLPFEGESSSHCAHKPPSTQVLLQALNQPAPQRDGQTPTMDALRAAWATEASRRAHSADTILHNRDFKFEAQSSSQSDFKAPPKEALLIAFQHSGQRKAAEPSVAANAPFEGMSWSKSVYKPPPIEAFREALAVLDKRPLSADGQRCERVKFEGQSSMQAQFRAPPADAFRSAFAQRSPPSLGPDPVPQDRIAFDGESSSKLDYRAPPIESLRQAYREQQSKLNDQHVERPESKAASTVKVKFEGESATHQAFQPPLKDALIPAFAHLLPADPVAARKDVRFEGAFSSHSAATAAPARAQSVDGFLKKMFTKSSSRIDFAPPPAEAYAQRATPASSQDDRRVAYCSGPDLKFEGESSTHRHFKAPSTEALLATFSSQPPRPRSAEHVAKKHAARFDGPVHARRVQCDGHSSSHRDFQAPSTEALLETFMTHQPRGRSVDSWARRPGAKFEGRSSAHLDFAPPPHESYRSAARSYPSSRVSLADRVGAGGPRFENQSTAHRDFTAPPTAALLETFVGSHVQPAAGGGDSKPTQHTTGSHGPSRRTQAKFEGETSSRATFVPPPRDAYLVCNTHASRALASRSASRSTMKFEGQSSTHLQFTAPGREALLATFSDSRCRARSTDNVAMSRHQASLTSDVAGKPSAG